MMLGLSLPAFTLLHTAFSLVALVAGLVWLVALSRGQWLAGWNKIYFGTMAVTTITSFMFPISGFTPALGVAVIVLVDLLIAGWVLARMKGEVRASRLYIITATIALYFDAFVTVAQSFLKVDFLFELAPSGSEPPFAVAQGTVIVVFAALGYLAVRRRRALMA